MAPLIVMFVTWIVIRAIGFAGVWNQGESWSGALRVALAAMFTFTAISHFHPRLRRDLIRMVPAGLPAPGLLVTVTGIFELIGAIGLLLPPVAPAAAYALIALLVVLFPALALRKSLTPRTGMPGRAPIRCE